MTRFQFSSQSLDLLNLTIPGERVELVSLNMDYDQVIFTEFTLEVTRYMFPKPPDEIEETREFIRRSLENMAANRDLIMVIRQRETSEFLGVCGLHAKDTVAVLEFGIWLKTDAHGHGFGREAITTLYHWVTANMIVDHFIYPVDKANFPSRKIPESLGGKVAREVQVTSQTGHLLDEVVYAIPAKRDKGREAS